MIQGVLMLLWLGLCAVQDICQRQIANSLTLGVGLLALIYLLWTGHTWLGAPAGDGGLALVLALLLSLPGYALGRFGAGDVKLLAAFALATHVEYLLWTLIFTGVAIGAWALMSQGLSARLAGGAGDASTKKPLAPFVLTGFVVAGFWIH